MMAKIKCNCPCHKDQNFKHIKACCIGGYVKIPDTEAGLYLDESPPLTSETDQPVPEEVMEWIKSTQPKVEYGLDAEDYASEVGEQRGWKNGAIAMYKREQATIADLQSRLSQIITTCQPIKDNPNVAYILKLFEGKKEGKV